MRCCQTTGTPAPVAVAAFTPFCPQSGEVTGTSLPNQVLTVTGQAIDAGPFDELLGAMRAGVTSPGGPLARPLFCRAPGYSSAQ